MVTRRKIGSLVKRDGAALTEAELEFMQILWRLGEGSVNDVLLQLPPTRKLAYTSVSTILRIMEQKGTLTSRKQGRGHVYVPQISRAEYESSTVKSLVSKVFNGVPATAVRQLLQTENLTEDDLKEIRRLIDERLG